MQPTKTRSLIIGASLGALINMGVAGTAGAQQSGDTAPPVKHKSKSTKKSTKADPSKDMAYQMQVLRDQVDALQRRLDAQSAAEQQTKVTADQAAAQAAAANAQAATATAATQAIPTTVQTAVEAAKPKTDKIYYKGVAITLGGFAAFESIYRSHNETSDISSSFGAIPLPNNAVGQTKELRFTARQSRISLLAQGDVSPDTHLAGYGEVDFQGAAQTANSNESNSYNPRLRVLYGQIDWDDIGTHFLAGQNWSLVTMQSKGITPRSEVIPPTIDAQYIPGFAWTRQPQIRITKDFDKTFWLALSAENPQTTFTGSVPKGVVLTNNATGANSSTTVPATTPPGGATSLTVANPSGFSGFNTVNTLSLNHIPDVVLKAAYEPTLGDRTLHAEVFGLYRSFYERLEYMNTDHSGGGAGVGLAVPIIPQILDFQVSGMAGKGIGRYGSGQLSDVTFDQAGNIKPISEVMGLAGLTLHATPALDFYLFAGEEKESAQPYYTATAAGVLTGYGYGNPLYVNSGCESQVATGACTANNRVIEQGTFGFWHKPYSGPWGTFRYGLQYSYTERKAFDGKGLTGQYAPVANDNMVFLSFRYYPFQ
jgi:hypothetical protein